MSTPTQTTTPVPTSTTGLPAARIELPDPPELVSARRIRHGVRAVLALAVLASVTANVLHAQPSAVGRAIAAWPPTALLLTVELISRVPVHSRRLAVLRVVATGAIAGIAAWVSYWHMVDVAHAHGETTTSARLIPLSVDGLIVVASICLIEIDARLRAFAVTNAVTTQPAVAPHVVHGEPDQPEAVDDHKDCIDHTRPAVQVGEDQDDADHGEDGTHDAAHRSGLGGAEALRRGGRVAVTGTAREVARLRRRHPDWSAAQIAARLGVHPSTVRRHVNAGAGASPDSPVRASTGARSATSTASSTGTSTGMSTAASTPRRTGARVAASTTASTTARTDPTAEDASTDAPAA